VAKPDLSWLCGLLKPSAREQRLLEHLFAYHGTSTITQLAAQLDVPVVQVLAVLAPLGLLRGTALIEIDAPAELGYPQPDERVQLGRGLLIAQHDRDTLPALLPGLAVLPTMEVEAAWAAEFVADRPAQIILELVKEKLVSVRPLLLLLSGCGGESAALLAQAVRLRLSRPVFFLDGNALAGFPQLELTAMLRRLRRDADLRGAALIVQDVEQLGASWRALTHPKPPGQTAPVILCSGGTLPQPRHFGAGSYGSPLQLHTHSLRPALAAAANPVAAASHAMAMETEPPEADRSREEARRQAALDAARAMGKPIPKELLAAAPVATTTPATPAKPSAEAPAKPTPAPEPAKAEAAPRPEAPATSSSPRPVNPRLAAALAKAGLPPAGNAPPRDERMAPATPSPSAVAVAVAVAPKVEAEPALAAPPAAASVETGGEESSDGPPLLLADDAKIDEMINVIKATPNIAQRCELLKRLHGTKSPLVIQLFRVFTTNAHPDVRAAAEAGMASLFGPNWNRARTIAPPVQPPRSDDGGRGPGGAF